MKGIALIRVCRWWSFFPDVDHVRVVFGYFRLEQLFQLLLQLADLAPARAAYRDAPSERAAQRAQHVDVGRGARHVVAGALGFEIDRLGQLGLDHVRQLEVLEEVIHEFFTRELENEIVLDGLLAVAGAAAARPAAAAARAVELVAFLVFGIARVDGFPHAAMGVAEMRFVDVLDGDRDFFAALDVGDRAALDGAADRVLDLRLVAAQEAFAVHRGLVLALQASVDEVSQNMPPVKAAADRLCRGPPILIRSVHKRGAHA